MAIVFSMIPIIGAMVLFYYWQGPESLHSKSSKKRRRESIFEKADEFFYLNNKGDTEAAYQKLM